MTKRLKGRKSDYISLALLIIVISFCFFVDRNSTLGDILIIVPNLIVYFMIRAHRSEMQ